MTRQEAAEWQALYKPRGLSANYEPNPDAPQVVKQAKPVIPFPASAMKKGKAQE